MLPYSLSSCMLHLTMIRSSTFAGFNEALFGVTTLPATLNTLSLLLWIFSYFHFSWDNLLKDCLKKWESSWMYSMNIIHNKCVFFKISSAAKVAFLGVGRSSKENLSLPYSLLLDYSTLRSLPYPTLLEVEKPLLVGACRWRNLCSLHIWPPDASLSLVAHLATR